MDPAFDAEDDVRELTLRPKLLSEFQGQAALKKNLEIFIRAAREREEALDHLFLMGPPGLGKTTLALVVANELGADFKPTSAPALEKPKDLAALLVFHNVGSSSNCFDVAIIADFSPTNFVRLPKIIQNHQKTRSCILLYNLWKLTII